MKNKIDTPEKSELESILDSSRYELLELVGKGCWGDVYKVRDRVLGVECAVKVLNPSKLAEEQMQERNLTPLKAMVKEAGLAACAYIVPRSLELDESEQPFIIMPYYKRFLSDVLRDDLKREGRNNYFGSGISRNNALGYLTDIAKGLSEMHRIRGRAHGDLKPDNIALDDNDRCLLNDLGTSTFASFGRSVSPRDNMGCLDTRAPELFIEGSHPNQQSDNYAWACLAYKIFTGENFPRFRDIEDHKKNVKNLIKRVPKSFREIVSRNLSYNFHDRNYNGKDLTEDLEKVIAGHGKWEAVKDFVRRFGIAVGSSVGIASVIALAGYAAYTHEPTRYDDGIKPKIMGELYPFPKTNERVLVPIAENVPDLPSSMSGAFLSGLGRIAKSMTEDRTLAYLLRTHAETAMSGGAYSHISPNQSELFEKYEAKYREEGFPKGPGPTWYVWKDTIVKALEHNNKNGKFDLEDVMVETRLGPQIVEEAKKISGSEHYQDYRWSKSSDGKEIIPKREREFIDQWISQYHADAN